MIENLTKEWLDDLINNKMAYMGDMPYEGKKAMLYTFIAMMNNG